MLFIFLLFNLNTIQILLYFYNSLRILRLSYQQINPENKNLIDANMAQKLCRPHRTHRAARACLGHTREQPQVGASAAPTQHRKTPRQRVKPGPVMGAKLSLLTLAQGGRCQGRRGDPELPKGTLQLHTPGGPSPSEWKRPLLQGPSSHQGGNPHS